MRKIMSLLFVLGLVFSFSVKAFAQSCNDVFIKVVEKEMSFDDGLTFFQNFLDKAEGNFSLGRMYTRPERKDGDKSLFYFEEARKNGYLNCQVDMSIAGVFKGKNDIGKARECLEKSVNAEDLTPDCLLTLGIFYASWLQEPDTAQKLYLRALSEFTDSLDAELAVGLLDKINWKKTGLKKQEIYSLLDGLILQFSSGKIETVNILSRIGSIKEALKLLSDEVI